MKKLIFVSVLIVFLFTSCSKKEEAVSINTNGIAHYQYYKDVAMWEHIFKHSEPFVIPEKIIPSAVMIPHHDIAIANQNSYYAALSKIMAPSVMVIISPDHFERGQKIISFPKDTVFQGVEGPLTVDYELISKIASDSRISDNVSLQDDIWYEEHGIFSHTPFIRHYFPETKIVPVVLKMLSDDDEFEQFKKLGQVLAELLPQDSLVVASVDCSHYQIPSVTAFHDYVIVNTLMRYEDPRYAEIDSPESMETLFSYNRALGINTPVMIHQSSTYDFAPDDNAESTSHLYISYFKDSKDLQPQLEKFYDDVKSTKQRARKINTDEVAQTLFFAGSGKTGAGIRKTWKWDRYDTSTDPADKLLKTAGGKEGRFLYGFDALIFDPEPHSVYERTLHGTKLVVSTILQSEFNDLYDRINTGGRIEKNKTIRVLEVVLEGEKNIPEEGFIRTALKDFHVVVFRDDDGLKDAMLFCRRTPFTTDFESINLGICHADGPVKGNVAFINFTSDSIETAYYGYESDTGILPEICQTYPPPGTPLLSEQRAPGDREN